MLLRRAAAGAGRQRGHAHAGGARSRCTRNCRCATTTARMMLALALSQQQGDAGTHAAGAAGAVRHRPLPPPPLAARRRQPVLRARTARACRRGAGLVRAAAAADARSRAWRRCQRRLAAARPDAVVEPGRLCAATRCGPAACAWPAGWRCWARWRPCRRRWRCAPGAGRWTPRWRRRRRWRSGASSSPTSRACPSCAG